MSVEELAITRLGQRGEGIAAGRSGPVYVPYALPGEMALADLDGDMGHLIELKVARSDRVAPICPYFGECGGCSVQALPEAPYAEWKRSLLVEVLTRAGLAAEVAPLLDAHGAGRRRATVHARIQPTPNLLVAGKPRVGFMRARSHEVIDLTACPVLSPAMSGALPAARALAESLASLDKPIDLVIAATDAGLDIDLRGAGSIGSGMRERLGAIAVARDLARLSNHGDIVLERRAPFLRMGPARVVLPPGAFLQATLRGEETLAALVTAGVGPAKKVADLFCGLGTFTFRLAAAATVHAVDIEGPPLAALARASGGTPSLRPVTIEARDLVRRPLRPEDLARFDAVVFDPPRAGAQAQAEALALSKVPIVVAVSCNAATFARDAGILVAGGYRLSAVTPVDQFRFSSHIEIVGVFRREKPRKARPLLG